MLHSYSSIVLFFFFIKWKIFLFCCELNEMNAEDWMMIIGQGVGERDIMTYIRNKKEQKKEQKNDFGKRFIVHRFHYSLPTLYFVCFYGIAALYLIYFITESEFVSYREYEKNKERGIEKKFAPLHRKNLLDPNFFVPFTLFLLFALFYIVLGLYLLSVLLFVVLSILCESTRYVHD